MKNLLCQICQRREVDCERFYREKVEQCDDFLEFDPTQPILPTQVEPTEWALSGTIPTAAPTVTDDDAVERVVGEPAPAEEAPTRRQIISKWLLTSALILVAIACVVLIKTSSSPLDDNIAIIIVGGIFITCIATLFKQRPRHK